MQQREPMLTFPALAFVVTVSAGTAAALNRAPVVADVFSLTAAPVCIDANPGTNPQHAAIHQRLSVPRKLSVRAFHVRHVNGTFACGARASRFGCADAFALWLTSGPPRRRIAPAPVDPVYADSDDHDGTFLLDGVSAADARNFSLSVSAGKHSGLDLSKRSTVELWFGPTLFELQGWLGTGPQAPSGSAAARRRKHMATERPTCDEDSGDCGATPGISGRVCVTVHAQGTYRDVYNVTREAYEEIRHSVDIDAATRRFHHAFATLDKARAQRAADAEDVGAPVSDEDVARADDELRSVDDLRGAASALEDRLSAVEAVLAADPLRQRRHARGASGDPPSTASSMLDDNSAFRSDWVRVLSPSYLTDPCSLDMPDADCFLLDEIREKVSDYLRQLRPRIAALKASVSVFRHALGRGRDVDDDVGTTLAANEEAAWDEVEATRADTARRRKEERETLWASEGPDNEVELAMALGKAREPLARVEESQLRDKVPIPGGAKKSESQPTDPPRDRQPGGDGTATLSEGDGAFRELENGGGEWSPWAPKKRTRGKKGQ